MHSMSARTVAAGCWNADRCRAVHNRRHRSGMTAHDQDRRRPTNQSELRRRCPHRHGPMQADDGQIALRPARPLCPTHHPEAITTTQQADRAVTATPKTRTNALVFSARNGASNTTPIASLPRGSVQSGFNEVALCVARLDGATRPHRSLQIPAIERCDSLPNGDDSPREMLNGDSADDPPHGAYG
jgi:hypothetical protein